MPEDTKSYRKLTVTSCDVLKTGTSTNTGNPWTMYEVFAVDSAGAPVEAKLRAFDELPINELVEYGITQRTDPRHGTSYTLELPRNRRPAKKKDTGFKGQIEELQLQVADLDQRCVWLLSLIHELQANAGVELSSAPANPGQQSPATAAPGAGAAGGALDNTNIPF